MICYLRKINLQETYQESYKTYITEIVKKIIIIIP